MRKESSLVAAARAAQNCKRYDVAAMCAAELAAYAIESEPGVSVTVVLSGNDPKGPLFVFQSGGQWVAVPAEIFTASAATTLAATSIFGKKQHEVVFRLTWPEWKKKNMQPYPRHMSEDELLAMKDFCEHASQRHLSLEWRVQVLEIISEF